MQKKTFLLGICLVICFGFGLTGESKAAQKQQPKKGVTKGQSKVGGTLIFGLGKEFANPNPREETKGRGLFPLTNKWYG